MRSIEVICFRWILKIIEVRCVIWAGVMIRRRDLTWTWRVVRSSRKKIFLSSRKKIPCKGVFSIGRFLSFNSNDKATTIIINVTRRFARWKYISTRNRVSGTGFESNRIVVSNDNNKTEPLESAVDANLRLIVDRPFTRLIVCPHFYHDDFSPTRRPYP